MNLFIRANQVDEYWLQLMFNTANQRCELYRCIKFALLDRLKPNAGAQATLFLKGQVESIGIGIGTKPRFTAKDSAGAALANCCNPVANPKTEQPDHTSGLALLITRS